MRNILIFVEKIQFKRSILNHKQSFKLAILNGQETIFSPLGQNTQLITGIPNPKKRLKSVIILKGYSSHNTTISSDVYNISTTCFDHCCSDHLQVGYKFFIREAVYIKHRNKLLV